MRSPLLSPPATFFPSRLTNNWKLCQTKQRSANHKLQNESRNERIFSLHILNWRTIQIIWCYWLTMVPSMAGNNKYFTCKSWNGSARAPVQSISLQFCVVVNMAEMAFIGMNAIARFDSAQFGQAIMVGNFVRLWSMCAAPYLLDFTGIALQVEMGPDRRRGVERTHTRKKNKNKEKEEEDERNVTKEKYRNKRFMCVVCANKVNFGCDCNVLSGLVVTAHSNRGRCVTAAPSSMRCERTAATAKRNERTLCGNLCARRRINSNKKSTKKTKWIDHMSWANVRTVR